MNRMPHDDVRQRGRPSGAAVHSHTTSAAEGMEQKQEDLARLLPLLRLPEQLSEDALKEISALAEDWCAAHGLTIRAPPAYENACFPGSKVNASW